MKDAEGSGFGVKEMRLGFRGLGFRGLGFRVSVGRPVASRRGSNRKTSSTLSETARMPAGSLLGGSWVVLRRLCLSLCAVICLYLSFFVCICLMLI